ncbi:hypothetical protein JTB14_025108 [Gonioctena quinquepunctata]|nr:hypothetical protein JTB14_025108 [Gonioctena quinquepunctata]
MNITTQWYAAIVRLINIEDANKEVANLPRTWTKETRPKNPIENAMPQENVQNLRRAEPPSYKALVIPPIKQGPSQNEHEHQAKQKKDNPTTTNHNEHEREDNVDKDVFKEVKKRRIGGVHQTKQIG